MAVAARLARARVARIALVLVISGLVVGLYRTIGWAQYAGRFQAIDVDLAQPDVLVRTRSLTSFFRDLLKWPLAQDLFGEDLVFYYETHPDRLGLNGSLRRIAYEHDVSWTDRIVASMFDEPAEVMLWRGPKGTLDYWAIAATRSSLATILQQAAAIATKDRQLTLAGEVTVDGLDVPVLAFEYGPQRTLLVAARGDRIVVLSHPGMLADGPENLRAAPA